MWQNSNPYYGNPYAVRNPNPYGYGQYQQQQPMQYNTNWQVVDGIEVVKAKDVDMSGMPSYYPQSDGKFIYSKQLQPDGTSRIAVYRLEQSEQPSVNQSVTNESLSSMFDQFKQDVFNELNGLRQIVESINTQNIDSTKTTRGGAK